MPLTLMDIGVETTVKAIRGKDQTRKFLQNLGFVEGAKVIVVSSLAGNVIVSVKDARVAISEQMAFALQTLSTLDTKAEDDISVMLVVRNDAGKLVSFEESQRQWNTMWEKDLFVGSLSSMPQKAGTYTLEIYFNHKLVTTKDFNVRES